MTSPRPAHRLRSALVLIWAVVITTGLTACAGEVPLEPAEGANDPGCAEVIIRLPETVAELDRRSTNAQSTGAWGDPAAVVLRCGITPTGPTTDDCVSVNDVDWVIDRSQAPLYRFEAYGRTPGLEVIIDSREVSGTEAILDLGTVVKQQLPQERHCIGLTDELTL